MKLTNHEDRIKYKEGMVVLCSWCEGSKELTRILSKLRYRISHGLCPECAKRVREEAKELLTKEQS